MYLVKVKMSWHGIIIELFFFLDGESSRCFFDSCSPLLLLHVSMSRHYPVCSIWGSQILDLIKYFTMPKATFCSSLEIMSKCRDKPLLVYPWSLGLRVVVAPPFVLQIIYILCKACWDIKHGDSNPTWN